MNSLVLALFALVFIHSSFGALNVTRINKGDLYVYGDGTYMGMFMVTPKGVVVVDAPPSSNSNGNSVLESIKMYTDKPVKWVVYSHHHLDHIGSASLYPKDAEYICHKQAADEIKDSGLPPCTKKIDNSGYNLRIDDEHILQLRYHGAIHVPGNLFVYAPLSKLLLFIDFVFPQWGPYHSLGMQATLVPYGKAFDTVLTYDFEYYVGGHVDRIGTRDDVVVGKQLWNDLVMSVKEGLATVPVDPIVEQNGGYNGKNTFTIFRGYTDAVVDYCAEKMLNELGWAEKLIDASAYMDTHCFLTYEFVGVNY